MLWHKIQGAGGVGGEPYLTMISEGQTNYSGLGAQQGDLVVVCAARSSITTDVAITSSNLTQAVAYNWLSPYSNAYERASIFYKIVGTETSFNLSGHTNYDAFLIRNANGPLTSVSFIASNTDTDGDVTISTATNVPGTVRAVVTAQGNTAKYVLNGVDIGTTRTKYRETATGYETFNLTERIFGGNDNGVCQDCCSIDPQSGTGSLRLDGQTLAAAAAAVITVS